MAQRVVFEALGHLGLSCQVRDVEHMLELESWKNFADEPSCDDLEPAWDLLRREPNEWRFEEPATHLAYEFDIILKLLSLGDMCPGSSRSAVFGHLTTAHLPLHKLAERAVVVGSKLLVAANFGDLTLVVENDNLIRSLDSGEPMGNGDGGIATTQKASQSLVDKSL
ncbi:hypothetical protein HG530_000113 [Fusarium avenaceum]|nr:hypothetical protein HG530_000113 [Fusarium avenaceum]